MICPCMYVQLCMGGPLVKTALSMQYPPHRAMKFLPTLTELFDRQIQDKIGRSILLNSHCAVLLRVISLLLWVLCVCGSV